MIRRPEYLSPTSVKLFYRDREEFYRTYLSPTRVARLEQTQPMSIGSAFDAYFKSYVTERLYGEIRDQFAFETIFEKQVEPQHRDWARKHGKWVFDSYVASGAMSDLMIELERAMIEPKFEFEIRSNVKYQDNIEGVVLLGKPDVWFVTKDGHHVIFDLKVNGYCSNSQTSPKPGYVMVRDGWNPVEFGNSRNNMCAHKDCWPEKLGGLTINSATTLDQVNTEWADQLSIYGWVLGEEVGGNFIAAIDQLCGAGPTPDGYTKIRVASHRVRINPEYQFMLLAKCWRAWTIIQSGHIFDDMLREDSDRKIEQVEQQQQTLVSDDPNQQFLGACLDRKHNNF